MKCPRCHEDDSTGPNCACGYKPRRLSPRRGRWIFLKPDKKGWMPYIRGKDFIGYLFRDKPGSRMNGTEWLRAEAGVRVWLPARKVKR